MTISTDSKTTKKQYIQVTPSEYIMYFTFRIANNIKQFCEDNNTWDIYSKETITNYIRDNKEKFQKLSNKLLEAINVTPMSVDPIKTTNFTNSKYSAKKNNGGRQFFVVRLEGRGAKGKTTTAEHLANKMKILFDIPKINVDKTFPHPLAKPAIYVVDDVLTAKNGNEYLHWINLTHERSIIILVTNIKYPIHIALEST